MHYSEVEQCQTMTSVVPMWIEEVQTSCVGDGQAQELIPVMLLTPQKKPESTYENGILKYEGRLYVGDQGERKKEANPGSTLLSTG